MKAGSQATNKPILLSMRPDKKNSKTCSILLCKKFIKLEAVKECQGECLEECQEEWEDSLEAWEASLVEQADQVDLKSTRSID